MENFIKINTQLLSRKDINSNEKLILSYIKSYQNNNKYYYAGETQIANELGMTTSTVKRSINNLIEKKILFKSQNKKYIKATFNNKKAIVLVDDNNEHPTAEDILEPTKVNSKKLNTECDTNIPEIKKEVVTKEIINNNEYPTYRLGNGVTVNIENPQHRGLIKKYVDGNYKGVIKQMKSCSSKIALELLLERKIEQTHQY